MSNKIAVPAAWLLAVFGCSTGTVAERAELYVSIDGEQVTVSYSGVSCSSDETCFNDDSLCPSGSDCDYRCLDGTCQVRQTIYFADPGDTAKSARKPVVVWNTGNRPLTIEAIYLEQGGNAYISIDPPFTNDDFPHVIEPNDQFASALKFNVVYSPGDDFDDRDSMLVIEANDPFLEGGVFRVNLAPVKKKPKIEVSPPNYTFVNASLASPDHATFKITNTGTDVLVIDSITFEDPTDEFTITNPPNKGATVYPQNSGKGQEELSFTLRYAPVDDEPDQNKILIRSNDPLDPVLGVPISGETEPGKIQVSYADQASGGIDFTDIGDPGRSCTKVVNVLNVGLGPLKVNEPTLQQKQPAYTVQWYEPGGSQVDDPAGCGEYQGTVIDSPVKALGPGKSLNIAVTYTAPGAKGVNDTLVIDYKAPFKGVVQIPLWGGSAKSQIDVAPAAGSQIFLFAPEGSSTTKTVVIMNRGNGPLTLHGLDIKDNNVAPGSPEAFHLKTEVTEGQVVPALGLLPITVEFTTDHEEPIRQADLEISYENDTINPPMDDVWTVPLTGRKDFAAKDLPVADPGTGQDYAGAKAGEPLVLDGSKSQAGAAPIFANGFIWFLSDKPASSSVFLNLPGVGSQVTFVPDVPGEYEIRLVVHTDAYQDTYLFSDEAAVRIDVQ